MYHSYNKLFYLQPLVPPKESKLGEGKNPEREDQH